MSIETAFSPVAFPSVHGAAHQLVEAQARTRGHAAGYAAGLRAAEESLREDQATQAAEHERLMADSRERTATLIATLEAAIGAVERRSAPVLAEAQSTVAEASLQLAAAIIGDELRDGEHAASAAVRRVLASVDGSLVVSLRMHPASIAALAEVTTIDGTPISGLNLTPDAGLEPGDAIAELPTGHLDASIGAALQRATAVLKESIG